MTTQQGSLTRKTLPTVERRSGSSNRLIRKSAFSATLIFLAGAALAQPKTCAFNVTGTYAVINQGSTIMLGPSGLYVPVPMASLGIATIDSSGAVSVSGYQSLAGQVTQTQTTGAIVVNSDCTASADFGGGTKLALVIVGDGIEMNSLTLTNGPSGAVTYGQWKKIAYAPNDVPAQCAANSLSGTYAYQSSGTVILTPPGGSAAVPLPVATLGMGSVENDGSVNATTTASIGGQIIPLQVTAASPLRVGPNCAVIATSNVASRGVALGQHQDFLVVLDGGNEVLDLTIKDFLGPSVELGTWTRISHTDEH